MVIPRKLKLSVLVMCILLICSWGIVGLRRGVWKVMHFVLAMLRESLLVQSQMKTLLSSLFRSMVACVIEGLIVEIRVVSSA